MKRTECPCGAAFVRIVEREDQCIQTWASHSAVQQVRVPGPRRIECKLGHRFDVRQVTAYTDGSYEFELLDDPDDAPPRKRYIVRPGRVFSRTDGDEHWISAQALIHLYQVDPRECVIDDRYERGGDLQGLYGLIELCPDPSGAYALPPITDDWQLDLYLDPEVQELAG